MTTSLFTPIHKSDLYTRINFDILLNSVVNQSELPDEWVILLNGDAKDSPSYYEDKTVEYKFIKIYYTTLSNNIGRLKYDCCSLCTSDILVELDYDDILRKDAIKKIKKAFESNKNTKFVYSNSIEFREDGSSNVYSEVYGWQHRLYIDTANEIGLGIGKEYYEMVAFPAKAQYLRRIEWAPNHVRAFTKEAYLKVGGYNPNIEIGDDHDLVCRFYLEYGESGFYHIDEPIYFYRVHSGNTCNASNNNIGVQKQVELNYIKYSEELYKKYAKDNNLLCIDLGGRFGKPDGYKSVDLYDADIIMDLNKPWEFEDNSVGVIRAYHILEHLPDTIHFFNEAYRVLAPGGFLLIEVPSTNGMGAFSDPTHIRFFNVLSFEYFTNYNYAKYIMPSYNGKFQKARLTEYMWESPHIPIVSGHFIALKGWYDNKWAGLRQI